MSCYRSVKGTMPAGQLWEAYKSVLLVNGTMYRLMALPPSAPQEAVNALRNAVVQLGTDRAYLDEANKITGDAPEYVTGPTLNDQVRQGLTVDPQLKQFMDVYAKKAGR